MTLRPVASRSGVTIVELLVVMGIVVVVLSLLTAFFQMQTRTTLEVQSRNEVETTARGVAEVVMQDLQLAGSRAVVQGTRSSGMDVSYIDPVATSEPAVAESDPEWKAWKATQCTATYRDGCVVLSLADVDVRIYYATSLERATGGACRRIDYRLDQGTLYRSDLACGAPTPTDFTGTEFASGITGLDLSFICHDPDTVVADVNACYSGGTYPREATVAVTGTVERREPVSATVTLATSLPNLRPAIDYLDLNP